MTISKTLAVSTMALTAVASAVAGVALAQDDYLKAVLGLVVSKSPETSVQHVDRERLIVRRVDIVDSKGVIRMTLAGDLPDPIVDGVQYKRQRPAGGLMLRDDKGNERGGMAYLSNFGVNIGLDHANGEGAGFSVRDSGAAEMGVQAKPAEHRPAELGGHLMPESGPSPFTVSLHKDGSSDVSLNDRQDRPRLVFKVTPEGYGAVEFLDAQGKVVSTIAPERDRAGK
jgi:hypothetical protein